MIWQLIQLDVAWRFVRRTTILFAALAALWHFLASGVDNPEAILCLTLFVPLFSIGVTPFVQSNDMRFQATLPVTPRQVFAARMLSALAIQWLPVVAGTTVLIVLGDAGVSGMLLRPWSTVTCIVLGIQCAAIRGLTIRRALLLVSAPVFLFILYLAIVTWDWQLQDSLIWNIAVVSCWLVTAAVVARTWQTLPESFQLAPIEVSSAGTEPIRADRTERSGMPWKPVLSTIFPLMGFEYFVSFAAMCIVHSPILVIVVSGQNWTSTRAVIRWMAALPVRPRVLLAVSTLPGTLSLTSGYLVSTHLGFAPSRIFGTGLRDQIVSVAFIALWSMLASLCAFAGDSHTLQRVLPSGRWPAIFPIMLMLAALAFIFLELDAVRWLYSMLPASAGGVIGVSAILLVSVWWALDATFRQMEFVDKPARGAA